MCPFPKLLSINIYITGKIIDSINFLKQAFTKLTCNLSHYMWQKNCWFKGNLQFDDLILDIS